MVTADEHAAACASSSSNSTATPAAACSSPTQPFLLAFEGTAHSKAVRCICCFSSVPPPQRQQQQQQQQQAEAVEELVTGGLDNLIVVWTPVGRGVVAPAGAAAGGEAPPSSSRNSKDSGKEADGEAAGPGGEKGSAAGPGPGIKYVPRLLLRPHTDYVYCLAPCRSGGRRSNPSRQTSSSSNTRAGGEEAAGVAEQQQPSFFSGSKDKRALHISAVDGRVLHEYSGHEGAVCSLAEVQQQALLVTGAWDGTARVWGISDATCRCILQPHKYAVTVLAVESMNLLVTGAQDKTLRFWSLTGSLLQSIPDAHGDIIRALDCMPPVDPSNSSSNNSSSSNSSSSNSSSSNSSRSAACGALLSASNDLTIKLWDWTSHRQLLQLEGHTAFVFDVKASRCRAGRIISAADDRTCRVWEVEAAETDSISEKTQPHLKQKLPQVLLHAATVWGVAELSSGEIATCCEDGVLRIWTQRESRALPVEGREKQRAAAEAATAEAAAAQPAEALDVESLPQTSQLATLRGTRDGEVKLFREGNVAVVYQWQQSSSSWKKIGEAVGKVSKQTYFYEGDEFFAAGEYDVIFTVDTGAGDSYKKLPFRKGEDPEKAAERFCSRERLHGRGCVEHVAAFIRRNMQLPAAGAAASSTAERSPDVRVNSSSSKHFPLLQPLRFAQAKNIKTAAQRIFAFDDALPGDAIEKLSLQERLYLESAFAKLQNFASAKEEFRTCEVDVFFEKLSAWPSHAAMPVVDCWRLLVLHPSNPLARYKRTAGDSVWHLVVVTLHHMRAASAAAAPATAAAPAAAPGTAAATAATTAAAGKEAGAAAEAGRSDKREREGTASPTATAAGAADGTTTPAGAPATEDSALLVCCLRFLANLLDSPSNRAVLLRHATAVLDAVAAALQANCSSSSKSVRAAAAVFYANFAVALSASAQSEDPSARTQVMQLLRELLAVEADADIFYRGLTALGTLLLTPQRQLRAAAQQQSKQLDFAALLPPLNARILPEGKVGEASQDLLLLLE